MERPGCCPCSPACFDKSVSHFIPGYVPRYRTDAEIGRFQHSIAKRNGKGGVKQIYAVFLQPHKTVQPFDPVPPRFSAVRSAGLDRFRISCSVITVQHMIVAEEKQPVGPFPFVAISPAVPIPSGVPTLTPAGTGRIFLCCGEAA
jgi:hypothetical protein